MSEEKEREVVWQTSFGVPRTNAMRKKRVCKDIAVTWESARARTRSEFLALKHESRILGHSSNPLCNFSMMEQVRLCAVWPMKNWLVSSLNQIQG